MCAVVNHCLEFAFAFQFAEEVATDDDECYASRTYVLLCTTIDESVFAYIDWTPPPGRTAPGSGAGHLGPVDLLDFLPLPHVSQIKGDFSDLNVQKKILEYLGTKPDLIVSDMAPSTTGNRQIDHLKIMGLLDEVLLFVDNNLCQGGNFAAKIFQGGGEREYMELLKKKFQKALFFKPKSSRSESVEMFVVAIGKK